jgi:type VI secretion system protein ImpH
MPKSPVPIPDFEDGEYLSRICAQPWSTNWFRAMRWIQARHVNHPRLGFAARPVEEVLRVQQTPGLGFAASEITSVSVEAGHVVLSQSGFGLFGPNGPLPLHITEYVRSLSAQDKDDGIRAFADIFHHRLSMLFFRAWSATQPCVSLDRPGTDDFGRYVSSLMGYGEMFLSGRDSVPDSAKRYQAGHLVRTSRNAEGLSSVLGWFFKCAVRVEEWVADWLSLDEGDRTKIGVLGEKAALGRGAVCGARIPDRAHRIRLHLGPLSLALYEHLLPYGRKHAQLRDWVRNYIGFELMWDVCLLLRAEDVPATRLAEQGRLGWTSWLGGNPSAKDRGDLILNFERSAGGCPGLVNHPRSESEYDAD